MGDKTFCHVAGSSRVEGFIWTLVCDVSLRLFSHPHELVAGGIFLSPFHQNRGTHMAAVKRTQMVINKRDNGHV